MGLFSKKSSDSVKEAADAVRKLSMSDKKEATAAAKEQPKPAAEAKAEPKTAAKPEPLVEEPAIAEATEVKGEYSLSCRLRCTSSRKLTGSRHSPR